jgi:Cu-Zn family superoxide dismutase
VFSDRYTHLFGLRFQNMRISTGFSFGAMAVLVTACGGGSDAPQAAVEQAPVETAAPAAAAATDPAAAPAVAVLRNRTGAEVGTVNFTQEGSEVVVTINARNLEGGQRAIHIHDVGTCESPFDSSGPHFNPEGKEHGLNNPNGPHAGDLPNMTIDPDDGIGRDVFRTDRVTLVPGQPNSLLGGDGTAVIVHAGTDDNAGQPAGNAGDRIVCGVIVPA